MITIKDIVIGGIYIPANKRQEISQEVQTALKLLNPKKLILFGDLNKGKPNPCKLAKMW